MPITNPKYKGRDLKLLIELTPSNYVVIGGMRATGVTVNNEAVDITDKDDDTFRKLLEGAGVRSLSVSGSGMVTNNAAFDKLRDNAFAGTITNFQIQIGNGDFFQGAFLVTSAEASGEYNGAQQFSCSLESANTITLTNVA